MVNTAATLQADYEQHLFNKADVSVPETVKSYNSLYNYQFVRIPAEFYRQDSPYHKLRPISKLAYAMLVNLAEYNLKKGVVDENGVPYLEETRERMQLHLHCSDTLLRLAMQELTAVGLIKETVYVGAKRNIVYVCDLYNMDCCNPAEFYWQFYRVPMAFFTDKVFKKLPRVAKLLYPVLVSSIEWDIVKYFKGKKEKETPFTTFTRSHMQEVTNAADKTVRKALRALIKLGLVYVKHIGFKIPQRIYVNAIGKKRKITTVTDNNNTSNEPIEQAQEITQTAADAVAEEPKKTKKQLMPELDPGAELSEDVLISYAHDVITYLATTTSRKYYIKGTSVSAKQMQNKIANIDIDSAIRYAVDVVIQAGGTIRDIGAYLTTLLYNYTPAQAKRQITKTAFDNKFKNFSERNYDNLDAVATYLSGGNVDVPDDIVAMSSPGQAEDPYAHESAADYFRRIRAKLA